MPVHDDGAGRWRCRASAGSRQPALALGPAGQMIAKAAVTEIGTDVYGGGLRRRHGDGFAGKALFLAADGEAGAHGVDLAACGEAGKAPFSPHCLATGRIGGAFCRSTDFPPCRAAVGRGTVRRMVEGAVGLGAVPGDRGDSRRVVFAAPAPPSAVPAATSPLLRNGEDGVAFCRSTDFHPCRAAVGRGTIRRMVEGAVGLGVGLGDRGDSRRVVIAGRAPPSAVPAATSPLLRNREDGVAFCRSTDFHPCRAAAGRGTIRRMVEGAVGLGAVPGDRGDSRRVVIAAPAPPSAVPAATSPLLCNGEESGRFLPID
jgi:hypothetical protein